MQHTDIHQILLYGLPSADIDLRYGHINEGRLKVAGVLIELGLAFDRELAAAAIEAPSVSIVVLGASMEDGTSVYVVPDAALPSGLRAALERCNGKSIQYDSDADDVELYCAYQLIRLANGACSVEDVRAEFERCGQPLAEDFASLYDVLSPYWARAPHTGLLRAADFDAPASRVYFVYEWL